MAEPAVKKRLRAYKSKTEYNLRQVFNCVEPVKEPFHFSARHRAFHLYVVVVADLISEDKKCELAYHKKTLPPNSFIDIHLWKKGSKGPLIVAF